MIALGLILGLGGLRVGAAPILISTVCAQVFTRGRPDKFCRARTGVVKWPEPWHLPGKLPGVLGWPFIFRLVRAKSAP